MCSKRLNIRFEFLLTLNWNNQLRNHGQHFGTTFLEHVENALDGQEAVGILFFSDSLKENGEIVVIVKLHHVDLPLDFVLGSVLNGDRQVTSIVETSEFAGDNWSALGGTGNRLLGRGNCLGGLK